MEAIKVSRAIINVKKREIQSQDKSWLSEERGNLEHERGLVFGLDLTALPPPVQWPSCPTYGDQEASK